MLKAPVSVRSPKLRSTDSVQNLDGWPDSNGRYYKQSLVNKKWIKDPL